MGNLLKFFYIKLAGLPLGIIKKQIFENILVTFK